MNIEQEARDLLERMGFEAQSMTSGDLVELANIIRDNHRYRTSLKGAYGWKIDPDGSREFVEPEDKWKHRIELFRDFCEAHEDFTDEQIREFLRDMAIAIVTEALRDEAV